MSLKSIVDKDYKQALLDRDRLKADTLSMVKSVILNQEIATGKRDEGLSDGEAIACIKKEAKKRHEAAQLYVKAGSKDRADRELAEVKILEGYLPTAMTEDDVRALIDAAVEKHGAVSQKNLGMIIGDVKQASKDAADGAVIARLVREKM